MIGRVKNCCPCRYLVDPFIHQWRGYDDPANLQDNEHQMVFEDRVIIITLPETNMAPENRPLEKEIPIGNHNF